MLKETDMDSHENNHNPRESAEEPQIYNVSFSIGRQKFSRRKFVEAAAITSAAAALSGCIPGLHLGRIPLGPTLTKTPTETPTPEPTATPSPTPTVVFMLIGIQGATLRSGPDEAFPSMATLSMDSLVEVISRLEDNSWFFVKVDIMFLPDYIDQSVSSVTGWVRADLLEWLEGNPFDLPTEEKQATPTPLPNTSVPAEEDAISYTYTDPYGNEVIMTLPCGAEIPDGAICTCNCVSGCSCVGYVVPSCSCVGYISPCSCDGQSEICSCNLVSYWYPN
jgi:hypothetical protein